MAKTKTRTEKESTTTETDAPVANEIPAIADNADTKSDGVIAFLAKTLVLIVTVPINFLARLLDQFADRNAPGTRALGGLAFIIGVLFGADNFYTLFTHHSLLPFFNADPWIGDNIINSLPQWAQIGPLKALGSMAGWAVLLSLPFRPMFYVALAISLLTQVEQGKALRGKSMEQAKADFKAWEKHKLPNEPQGKVDMAKISWDEYKKVGVAEHRSIGFYALLLWAFEIVSAFHSHWPLRYMPKSGVVLGALAFTLFTIFAGEMGYRLFLANKNAPGVNT